MPPHSRPLAIVIAAGLALACTTTPTPTAPVLGAEESFDGLRKVENARAGAAWARPDFDISSYDKVRLLPFDEYVPFRRWIGWPSWITRLRRDATQGSTTGAFETAGVRYGVQICFESLFASDGRRTAEQGVDFLVTLTNETFASSETAHELLFAMNLFRAAENGLPLVRASTTTISAVVAADGTVLERGSGNPGIIVADLPAARGPTLYTRYGDWALLALAGLSLVAVISRPRTARSSRGIPVPAHSDAPGR